MNATNTVEKQRKPRRVVSARAKAQAVLAVWGGRRNSSQVCRELGVNWGTLNIWERKGLQGIHKALGGEAVSTPEPGELGRRLEGLLGKLSPEKTSPSSPLTADKQE